MWTPYEISVVIHHYGSMAPFPRPDAPIYWPTVDRLKRAGILADGNDSPPVITELGKALVRMWCETPVPVVEYVDPRFAERRPGETMQEAAE